MAIGENLEIYSFDYLLQLALSYVPDDLDKREGSIIYDTIAPVCYVLSDYVMNLRNFYRDTYALTASGEDLDNRVREQGLIRHESTYALRKAYFTDGEDNPIEVPIGSRFSTISDTNPIIYFVVSHYEEESVAIPGTYVVQCESPGIIGNQYSGALINISIIPGIANATLSSLIQPARDTETDEELRTRYLQELGRTAFGGNIQDYKQKVGSIPGVGGLQVYPVWNGGGTVKLSVIDSEYNPCSPEFIETIQTEVDPEVNSGIGLGIAPIGHQVTVVTPTSVNIDIEATIVPDASHTKEQLQPLIEDSISDYLLSLRKLWPIGSDLNVYTCSVYLARITSSIISVPGVSNVTGVKLNGEEEDIDLTQTGQLQQIPIMGTVVINE